jgi:ketol-acid reductoisomerase
LIKDKEGLNINVNLYSMKHLGANKKILAGMELDTLRELYGHSSKMMTLTYAKNVKEIYRNQIMENSPDF